MSLSKLVLRSVFGGTLMGLANLVPGISGGTMLLAAGIYPDFIESVSNVTRFRFRLRSLLLLACVAVAAGVGILLLAGPIKGLVVQQRWAMYSLFIGLTLGGVPVVWRLTAGWNKQLAIGAFLAFSMMVGLALLQAYEIVGDFPPNIPMYLFAGLAGASAMILPGLSGGYLLLLLGQYVVILSAISTFKDALQARDLGAALEPACYVMAPVGIGVLLGIVLVGNLLQWLLKSHRDLTLGVLLGLLLGSTAGLFPFQAGVPPEIGDVIKGELVNAENIDEIDPEDYKTQVFSPSAKQVFSSLLLIAAGFAATMGIERIGAEDPKRKVESDG